MSTLRIEKGRENPYVMVDKYPVNDAGLSWGAKGLLVYLLSKPDDWVVKERDLVNHGRNGRDAVRTLLKELREAGYLVRVGQRRVERGRLGEIEYVVRERPVVGDEEAGGRGESVSSLLSKRSDSPSTDFQATVQVHKRKGARRKKRTNFETHDFYGNRLNRVAESLKPDMFGEFTGSSASVGR